MKSMEIEKAIEKLKSRHEYIVPNSDMDEAIETAIKVMEASIEPKVIMSVFNDAIKSDKIIDEFLRDREGK